MSELLIKDDNYCFACGKDNPEGLCMEVTRNNGRAEALVTLRREHQGWVDIAHGGLVSTILDEMMAHAVVSGNPQAVTAEMKIRFRHAVPLGRELKALGWVEEINRRRVIAHSELRLAEDDKLLASGESKFLIVT